MCMYLEDIMLSEISQTEKDKYSVITYMWNLKKRTKTNVYNKIMALFSCAVQYILVPYLFYVC